MPENLAQRNIQYIETQTNKIDDDYNECAPELNLSSTKDLKNYLHVWNYRMSGHRPLFKVHTR